MQAAPRFTSLQAQIPHLFCADDVRRYASCLLQPAGQIDRRLIVGELDAFRRYRRGTATTLPPCAWNSVVW